jgi:hypothetical protein
VLCSDASGAKAKTIAVSGLPTGLSYSDTTGLITGTPTGSGTTTISVTVTNSLGQSVTSNVDAIVAASHTAGTGITAPSLSGVTLVADYDFDKDSTQTIASGSITNIADNSGSSAPTLASTSTNRPTQATRNGLHAALFAKASSQRLSVNSVSSGLDSSHGFTIVVIAEPVTVATTCTFYEMSVGSDALNANRLTVGGSSSVGYHFRKYDNNSHQCVASVGSVYNTGLHLMVAHAASNAGNTTQNVAKLNVDGSATVLDSGATVGFFPAGMAWTTIGCNRQSNAFNQFADAYVYRVLVYQGEADATNIEAIATWATTNYGTPNNA